VTCCRGLFCCLQASCGFCQPQAVSPLASLAGSSSSSSQAGMLLDECQDDINVCPFLAATGLCSSGSMWVETQCARSCGQCSTAAGSAAAGECCQREAHIASGPGLRDWPLQAEEAAAD
jgi:hypothetical protein